MRGDPSTPVAPLNEEQRKLASQYVPMARRLVHSAYRTEGQIERDELESTAYLALVEAARTFDPERNVNFATYARHHIEGSLQDCKRETVGSGWRGDELFRPKFQALGKNADLHGHVIGVHPDLPVGALEESIEAVEEQLVQLPPIHAWICRLLYVYGMTRDDAAEHLGYSKSYFSRLHQQALNQLIRQQQTPQTPLPGIPLRQDARLPN